MSVQLILIMGLVTDNQYIFFLSHTLTQTPKHTHTLTNKQLWNPSHKGTWHLNVHDNIFLANQSTIAKLSLCGSLSSCSNKFDCKKCNKLLQCSLEHCECVNKSMCKSVWECVRVWISTFVSEFNIYVTTNNLIICICSLDKHSFHFLYLLFSFSLPLSSTTFFHSLSLSLSLSHTHTRTQTLIPTQTADTRERWDTLNKVGLSWSHKCYKSWVSKGGKFGQSISFAVVWTQHLTI